MHYIPVVDAVSSLIWSPLLGINTGSKLGTGILRDISVNPFGYTVLTGVQVILYFKISFCLLIFESNCQIIMWKLIKEHNPIWFFDATGSIVSSVKNQKAPFLYSIVAHDTKKKIIVPIAEFITTSHYEMNISKYLFSIKKHIRADFSYGEKYYPSIIVTDFSWALINPILENFTTSGSIENYLLWCYEILIKNTSPPETIINHNQTLLILCHVHFFKMIIKNAADILKKQTIQVSNVFKFIINMLIHSNSMDQFQLILKHFFVVFNTKLYTEEVCSAIDSLEYEIKTRELTAEQINKVISDNQLQNQPNKFQDENDVSTIKKIISFLFI